MGKGARALQKDPNNTRELHTFWDGRVVIDVSAADYDCETSLAGFMVRGIECADTSGGNVIKVDHLDQTVTTSPFKRTNQSLFMAQGAIKAPLPIITKVYTANTTVGKTTIALYYQRVRA